MDGEIFHHPRNPQRPKRSPEKWTTQGAHLQGQCYREARRNPDRSPASTRKNADSTVPTNKDKRPPIYITHQDWGETVKLIEETLNTKSFHIKRIYAEKHVLFLRSIPDFNKAKEILIAVQTAFYAHTATLEKYHTVSLKVLNNCFSETEIVAELQALQMSDVPN